VIRVPAECRAELVRLLVTGVETMVESASETQIVRALAVLDDPDHKSWAGYGPIAALCRLLDAPSPTESQSEPNSAPSVACGDRCLPSMSHRRRQKLAAAAAVERSGL